MMAGGAQGWDTLGPWMVALKVAQRRLQGEQQECCCLTPGQGSMLKTPVFSGGKEKRRRLRGSEGVSKPWDMQSSSPMKAEEHKEQPSKGMCVGMEQASSQPVQLQQVQALHRAGICMGLALCKIPRCSQTQTLGWTQGRSS